MNSREKLAWEQELWDEFAAAGYANNLQDGKSYYPVVGIVGMIRSGYGKYKGLSVAEQDARIAELGSHTTDWFEDCSGRQFPQATISPFREVIPKWPIISQWDMVTIRALC